MSNHVLVDCLAAGYFIVVLHLLVLLLSNLFGGDVLSYQERTN
jgi:hypothetical protein